MLERVSPGCVVARTGVLGLILSATTHPPLSAISRGEAVILMMDAPPASREVGVPTVHRFGPYRFFFWSQEHDPPHIHVQSGDGAAVFVLAPVGLQRSDGYTSRQLHEIEQQVISHRREFLERWHAHFVR